VSLTHNYVCRSGKANALGYELYAFVAEANGQALPMLFMFIDTDENARSNAKRRMLAACIRFVKPCCPNLKFVLTDKDASEIGAIRDELPGIKHQLCHWHVLRYLADRLAENTKPLPYSGGEAFTTHAFVNTSVKRNAIVLTPASLANQLA
jgi:hypothetical protein